jgi:type IV secretion system protein VirD4
VSASSEKRGAQSQGMVFGVIGAGAVLALLIVGAILAARVSGQDLAGHHTNLLRGVIMALLNPRNPSKAWGRPVGPVWRYWTVSVFVFVVPIGAALGAYRAWRNNPRNDPDNAVNAKGLATRREIVRAAGPKQLVARGAVLRPSLSEPTPSDLGACLGTGQGVKCYSSSEDSMIIVGPPRSGKGFNLVIPMILDAPGPVITTSTRPDSLGPTLARRAQKGPVAVFDPQGLAVGVPSALRWSPIRGCEQAQTAMIRANALCADVGKGVTESSYWQQQTTTVVRCLLHAAALDGRPPSDLYRWSLSAPSAQEAVEILTHDPRAAGGWGRAVDAIITAEQKMRDNVWSMVSTVFAPLADPHVLAAISPSPGEEFDPARFLRENGTLYLLATASGASTTTGLVSALVEDVVETARRIASASPGARLDPPLSLILDEAANYPLPSLASLMSEGGGTGITTTAVLQSPAQARDRWGTDVAQAIWDSAIAKVILGGSSDATFLRDVSHLIGEREYQEFSKSQQARGGRTINENTRRRDILDPAMLRSIRQGHALLLLRSAKPIMLDLRPWTARKDAAELRDHRTKVEELIRAGAAERWGTYA